MKTEPIDVSFLPTSAVGQSAPIWWGTVVVLAIESTAFALLIAAYFYTRLRFVDWPPAGIDLPELPIPVGHVILLVLSLPVMHAINKRAIEGGPEAGVQILFCFWTLMAALSLMMRTFEFTTLQCRWDTNAYGSLVWTMMGIHTTHLLAAFLENLVLFIYLLNNPLDEKRRLDINANSLYWDFVVVSWLVLFAIIYLSPRIL